MSLGKFISLGSSSKGNCYYLEIQTLERVKPYKLLLEVGFDYNTILKKLTQNGISINDIDAVLISHEHQDHSKAIKNFIERDIFVFAPDSVFKKSNIDTYAHFIMQEYQWKEILEGVNVFAIPLEHFDKGEKIYNLGYIIKDDTDFRLLFVTDTKYIPQDLSKFKFDIIMIEANYLEDKVTHALRDARMKKNIGKIERYSRLIDSHLSLENLARTLDGTIKVGANPFDLSKTNAIFLLHLSSGAETNDSYYREFLKRYIQATRQKTNAKEDIKVFISKQDGGFL